jgi:hypothetical protein
MPEWRIVFYEFFDDSGKEGSGDSPFPCLAGYLAHETYWAGFLDHWRHLLVRHGLPALHMKTLIRDAEERGWNARRRNEVVSEFIAVMKGAKLIGFGVAVDSEAWATLAPVRRKKFGNAQEFCFTRIMRRICDRLDLAKESESVTIVFDRDFEFARRRLSLFTNLDRFNQRVAERYAGIMFADAARYLPLQAADLLAWSTRRELMSRAKKLQPNNRYHQLLAALPYYDPEYAAGEFWDQAEIDKYFPEVEAEWDKWTAADRTNPSPPSA